MQKTRVYYLCECLSLNNQPKSEATMPETAVITRKKTGITHNSRSLSVGMVGLAVEIGTEMHTRCQEECDL